MTAVATPTSAGVSNLARRPAKVTYLQITRDSSAVRSGVAFLPMIAALE